MEEVIQRLLNDVDLQNLTGGQIRRFGDLPLGKGLVYEFSTVSSNGVVANDRLTITAVSYSINDSITILDRVKKILITIGDTPFSQSVKKIVQNGGGSAKNAVNGKEMFHFTAIFYITRREN